MRLVRYGHAGSERPGMLDGEGALRDLSYVLIDIGPEDITEDALDILRAIEPATLPPVVGDPPRLPPLSRFGAVFKEGVPIPDVAIVAADAAPRRPPAAIGLAAVLGAPGWAGAFMLAALYEASAGAPAMLAVGPWLLAPDRPLKFGRLRVGGSRPFDRHSLANALKSVETAAKIGDIALLLAGRNTDAEIAIAGFGAINAIN